MAFYIISFVFSHNTATNEIYTLSLHDALPIFYKMFGYPTGVGCLLVRKSALARLRRPWFAGGTVNFATVGGRRHLLSPDRKSTRLNSSHLGISYAVFCLKKKKKHDQTI